MDSLKGHRLPVILFLFARLSLVMGQTIEGLRGYGDFPHFYMLAKLGRPFFDIWVEFPPVFPFLSALLYRLAAGRQHTYDYLLVGVLTCAQAGGLVLFLRLAGRIYPEPQAARRGWVYLAVLLSLFYGWNYFDPLTVFFLLLGLVWLFEGRDIPAGLALACGALTKLFPLLALVIAWRYRRIRRAVLMTAIVFGMNIIVWGGLFALSPEYTAASFGSQSSKGSWETIWGLVDGNVHAGNFGPLSERFDPQTAYLLRGNPPRISPWITLLGFGGLGAWFMWRARPGKAFLGWEQERPAVRPALAFLGLAWSLFLLWMPGYSPQWLLYLLPIILLALPEREALLMTVTNVCLHLLEWPMLLSRGFEWSLWYTVPLRALLLVLMIISFWSVIRQGSQSLKIEPANRPDLV